MASSDDGSPVITPAQQRDELEEANERILKMIRGKIEPPNEFVAYCLEKLRESRAEYEALSSNIRNAEQQLEAMKQRQLVVQGETNKYLEDIRNWDKDLVAEPGETEAAPAP